MLLFKKRKDGGIESNATGYWLIEIKKLFSIVFIKFEGPSRENYHSHAFNALTWFIRGNATEIQIYRPTIKECDCAPVLIRKYKRSIIPKYTSRKTFHKVNSEGVSWAFSIRGPWKNTWEEYDAKEDKYITLSNGREIV